MPFVTESNDALFEVLMDTLMLKAREAWEAVYERSYSVSELTDDVEEALAERGFAIVKKVEA